MDDDNRHIIIDCPTCKRTIWAESVCHHGQPPTTPNKDAPKEVRTKRSGGLKRRKYDEDDRLGVEVDD